jgi:hypothetical protein
MDYFILGLLSSLEAGTKTSSAFNHGQHELQNLLNVIGAFMGFLQKAIKSFMSML